MIAPRFSVVMPLYNKAPHVEAAVRSVLAQTAKPFELLVIDDGSTDGGRERIETMADPGIRLLLRGTPGPGGYAARNLGIERAAGDWIAFLDADDIWSPDHLEVLGAAIARVPSAGVAATRFDHVFDTHRVPQRVAERLKQEGAADFRRFLEAWLAVRECPMWTGAIAVRRDLLIRAGLFPVGRAPRGGDKDLWLRCMRHATLAYSPQVTAEFNRDSTNKVSKATSTLAPPCLVETARQMLGEANPEERKLLRRLINQEIGHYVRYSMKSPGRIGIGLGEVALPEGVRTLALLAMARWTPAMLRQAGYRLFTRRPLHQGALVALLLLLLVAHEGPASAQQYDLFDRLGSVEASDNPFGRDRNVAVTERSRPDYAAKPIRAGSWEIMPQLAAEASYEDNIFFTESSKIDDLIIRARPRLSIGRPDPNFSVSLAGEYEAARYLSNPDENTDTYALKGDLRTTIRRDTTLRLRLLQAREAEGRFSPDSLSGIARPNRFDISEVYGEAAHTFNRLRVRGSIDYERRDYRDNRDALGNLIDQDFRDRSTVTGSAIAEYAVSPSLSLFAAGSVNRRDYATRIGPVPARDSDGYEAAMGASFEIGRLTRASLRFGYLGQDYRDPLFGDVNGMLVRGEVAYFVSPLVTLTAKLDRSVVESGLAGSSGYLRTGYSLRADHELLRNLILRAELGGENRRYNGVDRDDSGFTGRFGASYLISPRWALRAEFSHRQDDSSGIASGREFSGNEATLGFVFKGL